MGLQNKGCKHSDVQQKLNVLTSIFWKSGGKKKGKKISRQQDHLLAIKWKDICDVFFLTTAQEGVLVEAPSSRGVHHKIKPAAVLDYNKYKAGVDKSDQMLSYTFERKTIKWWKKLFLHLLNLVLVNAHVLHNKTSKKESRWKYSKKKVTEGLLASAGMEISARSDYQSNWQTCMDRPFCI